jgi:hypothetical protein
MEQNFSQRYGYEKNEFIKMDDMPLGVRNRLWNIIGKYIDADRYGRDDKIEKIWDKFFRENIDNLHYTESYY